VKLQIIGIPEPLKDGTPLIVIRVIELPKDHLPQPLPLAPEAADVGGFSPKPEIQVENPRHEPDQQHQAHEEPE